MQKKYNYFANKIVHGSERSDNYNYAIRARSKKEIYDFVRVEGEVLLPLISYCNHKFIKQIVSGEKKVRSHF